jgi:FAD dependent oxidoreductase TIGR03364
MQQKSAIVIGAGIVGLATARALAVKGYAVKIIERNQKAVGASIRNFGMIWPIGQPSGHLYQRALRSKSIWKTICDDAGIWYDEVGSLHVAHHQDEWQVLKELYELFYKERPVELLSKQQVANISAAAQTQTLLGGLYSTDEMIINPVKAIEALSEYLTEKYEVEFLWGKCASYIADATVYIGTTEEYEADLIFVCSGADFETLYPEEFVALPFTKCKLQMMRTITQPDNWHMGAALCGGLSLIHYKSFTAAPSLAALKNRYQNEMSDYTDLGIHVMACQNENGQITIGDSHEYGLTHDPFDKDKINSMILSYLKEIAVFKEWHITETWNGIYPKLTDGETDLFYSPEQSVYIVNGLGGAGMTLSFGFAEEVINTL